jgi:hypothetical protein
MLRRLALNSPDGINPLSLEAPDYQPDTRIFRMPLVQSFGSLGLNPVGKMIREPHRKQDQHQRRILTSAAGEHRCARNP